MNITTGAQMEVIRRYYCSDVKFLVLKARPFHLLRVFVYVDQGANAKSAMEILVDAISREQNKIPESIFHCGGRF